MHYPTLLSPTLPSPTITYPLPYPSSHLLASPPFPFTPLFSALLRSLWLPGATLLYSPYPPIPFPLLTSNPLISLHYPFRAYAPSSPLPTFLLYPTLPSPIVPSHLPSLPPLPSPTLPTSSSHLFLTPFYTFPSLVSTLFSPPSLSFPKLPYPTHSTLPHSTLHYPRIASHRLPSALSPMLPSPPPQPYPIS